MASSDEVGGQGQGRGGGVDDRDRERSRRSVACASVAEQSTDVGPKPKAAPLGGSHDTATLPSTRSVAVVVKLTGAPVGPVASAVNEAGSVRVGAVVSLTVTLNCEALELPRASAAVQSTGVGASRAKVLPDGGAQIDSDRAVDQVDRRRVRVGDDGAARARWPPG